MSQLLSDAVETLLSVASPQPHPVLEEMTAYGEERGFPTVGADVGQFLTLAARMVGADRIFEFGSGYGYSAAWFVQAMDADSEIILTDYDEANLATAQGFLADLGYQGTARFEAGDAVERFEETEGAFDVVLIDLDKEQYVDAFSRARERVAPGGIIVADNMMAGPVDAEAVTAALRGREPVEPATAGIARYIERVRSAPDFETAFVPLGEGIAISYRLPEG